MPPQAAAACAAFVGLDWAATHHEHAFPAPPTSKQRRAGRRARHAAARHRGATGAARGPSACATRVARGRRQPPGRPAGRRALRRRHARQARPPRLPGAPWPSQGSASALGVGRRAPRRRPPAIAQRSNAAAHFSCTSLRRYPARSKTTLTAPLRACVRLGTPLENWATVRACQTSCLVRSPLVALRCSGGIIEAQRSRGRHRILVHYPAA